MSRLRKVLYVLLVLAGIVVVPALMGQGLAGPVLTLEEAVTEARKHHPRAALAEASVDAARAAVKGARASQYPSFSVGEDVLYSNDPVFAFGSKLRQARFTSNDFDLNALNHPSALSNFSGSGSGTWKAFDGGSTRHSVRSAEASLQASELSSQYTAEQLAAEITALFYRVLTAEDQANVAKVAVARAREVDESVQDRVHAGLSLESDGARAHLALRSAEDDAATVQGNIVLARRDLFAAMGRSPTDEPLERTVVDPTYETDLPRLAGDPQKRLDIQALDYQQQAAHQSLSAVRATAWPQVTALGHIENDAQWLVTHGSANWAIGAKVQWNVFDGGARRSRELEAASRIHTVEAQKRASLLEADSTIAALESQIEDLQRRLATANEAIRTQDEALKTSRDRYKTGLLTITDVLSNETALSEAEFQRVRTYYQIRIANANLALASGTVTNTKAGQP